MQIVAGALIGLLFGFGLVVSGMTDPEKILNFLDVTGRWDPSLIFVMAGAITIAFIGHRLFSRREAPLLGDAFSLPNTMAIDHRAIIGPAIFGIGWGLAGFCPGPAIASLTLGSSKVLVFTVAMFAGLAVAKTVARAKQDVSLDPT